MVSSELERKRNLGQERRDALGHRLAEGVVDVHEHRGLRLDLRLAEDVAQQHQAVAADLGRGRKVPEHELVALLGDLRRGRDVDDEGERRAARPPARSRTCAPNRTRRRGRARPARSGARPGCAPCRRSTRCRRSSARRRRPDAASAARARRRLPSGRTGRSAPAAPNRGSSTPTFSFAAFRSQPARKRRQRQRARRGDAELPSGHGSHSCTPTMIMLPVLCAGAAAGAGGGRRSVHHVIVPVVHDDVGEPVHHRVRQLHVVDPRRIEALARRRDLLCLRLLEAERRPQLADPRRIGELYAIAATIDHFQG